MQVIYLVIQCVQYEGEATERVFSLEYDAEAYALMLEEAKPHYYGDVSYEVRAALLY